MTWKLGKPRLNPDGSVTARAYDERRVLRWRKTYQNAKEAAEHARTDMAAAQKKASQPQWESDGWWAETLREML